MFFILLSRLLIIDNNEVAVATFYAFSCPHSACRQPSVKLALQIIFSMDFVKTVFNTVP